MPCVCCGNDGPTYPIPSHVGNLKACARCLSKHGADNLGLEADRLLTAYFLGQRPKPVCACCKGPVILNPDKSIPLWCNSCELKRREYVAKLNAKSS